jgi:exopolysaccharide production protein ExoZ
MPSLTQPLGTRQKYLSLQAGRAIAALLVVLHHVSSFADGEPLLWTHPQIGRWLAGPSLGVAFFFVLSGIVILTAHWDDIGNPAAIRSYLLKRFYRIYPIYWIVLVVILAGQLRHQDAQFPFHHDPWVILSSILLVHIHSSETNLVVAWTLFHELDFYLVFAAVLLNKRIGLCMLALWFAASLVNIPGEFPAHSPSFFAPVHLLFACGLFAGWVLHQRRVPAPGLLLIAGTLFFLAIVVYSGKVGYVSQDLYLVSGFGSMFAILGAAELERSGRLRIPQWLVFLGDASYSIYLIHYPVVSHLAPLAFRLDGHLHLPIALWMLLLMAAGTTAGCLLHYYIERPLLQRLKLFARRPTLTQPLTAGS